MDKRQKVKKVSELHKARGNREGEEDEVVEKKLPAGKKFAELKEMVVRGMKS